ncbi:MAG: transcriptional regulator [Deltaproteobacteria bacterium]|nr:transcriptional regulator [Nannocystaceae bacterium]
MAKERQPRPANETIRDALRAALTGDRSLTALELSSLVGIAHKQVDEHLEHLQRSLAGAGDELVVEPARCTSCEYIFKDRTKLGRPSRCPKCKGERVEPPRFRIADE